MSMIKSFLKEKAVWEKKSDKPNEYGKFDYIEEEIKCHIDNKFKLVVTNQGEHFVNYSKVFTNVPIQVGDRINGIQVRNVNVIKNGRKVEGVEAILQ